MKLLVDVGNTAIKLASHQDGKISFLAADQIQWQDVEHVLVASVRTNTALNSLLEQAKRHEVKVTIAAVSATHNGVSCAYKAYQNLGVDRWLVVLAAAKLYPGRTSLIVDAGTATTLDVLIDGKQHLGGWIVPGIDLMMESITSRAEKVFSGDSIQFVNQVGTDTPAALSYGCLAASLGLVSQARQLYGKDIPVLCTGGYGNLLAQHIDNSEFIEDLVLQGLVSYA